METNKIVLIVGLIFILFFIIRNIKIVTSSPTTTKSTVVYRKPVTPIAGPNPHYNSYKSQYYN